MKPTQPVIPSLTNTTEMYTTNHTRKTYYTEPRPQSSSTANHSFKRPSPEPFYSPHFKKPKQQSDEPFYKRANPPKDGEHDDL